MDYDIFENGISGYAPQGGTGVKGADGYNFYYSALSYLTDSDIISERVANGKSLTDNENILTDVSYKNNDMILCSNADMLIVKISDSSTYVEKIGSLIKSKNKSKDSSSGLASYVIFYIKYQNVDDCQQNNEYNYCQNSTTLDAKSPLYHHRSAMHEKEYGFKIYTKTPYQKGDDPKICIQFNNGMRFVSPCNKGNTNDYFFINNGYFPSYGCWEDKEYWGTAQIKSEHSEFNPENSKYTKNLLLNDSSICISNGYIETSGMSGKDSSGNVYDSSTLYRIPIIFKEE
jgi:hypothetical protein